MTLTVPSLMDDTFKVLVSDANVDDANNLNNMIKTSLLNKENGIGGYSEYLEKLSLVRVPKFKKPTKFRSQ